MRPFTFHDNSKMADDLLAIEQYNRNYAAIDHASMPCSVLLGLY